MKSTLYSIFLLLILTISCCGDVLTYHNDNSRTGVTSGDSLLTVHNVNALTFGLKYTLTVDGQVYAQPLVCSNISIRGILHDLLIIATEHDSVYGFDALTGALLWHSSILGPGEVPADSINCSDLTPENGITSTPVIDLSAQLIYVVGMSRTSSGQYLYRLHALQLSSGTDVRSVVISAHYPGTFPAPDVVGGQVQWVAHQQRQRAALMLANGIVYTAYGSFCDRQFYAGWLMAYHAADFSPAGVFDDNTTAAGLAPGSLNPNGSGGGIWNAMAANSDRIYISTGNGPFDGHTTFSDCIIKLTPTCVLADYFVSPEQVIDQQKDTDLGSGGAVLLSQGGHSLCVVAGKTGTIYLVDSSTLKLYQSLKSAAMGPIYGVPAYYNNALYYGPVNKPIVKLVFSNGILQTAPGAKSSNSFPFPGTIPSIVNGVLFAIEHSSTSTTLFAYDTTDLHQLYKSTQNATLEAGVKFAVPTIFQDLVYVGTQHHVYAFGLK